MASEHDLTEFVDTDFEQRQSTFSAAAAGLSQRAPSREEVDVKMSEAQQKLAELKRAQEGLERQRADLEETRRRQIELQTGREEMSDNLTRGITLLEEAEFDARQEAEQMAKTLAGLHDAREKISAIQEQSWSQEDYQRDLTRALTVIENARMEWNTARLKFPLLSGKGGAAETGKPMSEGHRFPLAELSAWQAFKLGLAMTWPLMLVSSAAAAALIVVLLQR